METKFAFNAPNNPTNVNVVVKDTINKVKGTHDPDNRVGTSFKSMNRAVTRKFKPKAGKRKYEFK